MAGVFERTAQMHFLLLLCFLSRDSFFASALTDPLDLSALRALYGAMGGPAQLTGWSFTTGDPCGGEPWRGVSCDGVSVTAIKIEGLGVGGFLGLELSTFLSLKYLDVSCNHIGGEIPRVLPPNATHINLAANSFSGSIPDSLPSLKSLIHLNVSHNAISGPIGNVFMDMRTLESLDLSYNQLTGDLPSSFASLSNLHVLYLQDNQFTGSVNFLANLPLSACYLQNNKFSGFIPKQFELIPHLRIDGNLFQPDSVFPPRFMNGSGDPRLPSADKNVSHSPLDVSGSFGFSSTEVRPVGHQRFSPGALVGTICGVIFMILLAMTFSTIYILKYLERRLDKSERLHESRAALPLTLPKVTQVHPDQCTVRHPTVMTSLRLPSVRCAKPERISRRCSGRSRNLPNAKLYTASELLLATNIYSEENLLGEGPSGCVYRAELPEGQVLAVKKINMTKVAIYEEEDFFNVVLNMSRLRHPNITNFMGYCVEQGEHILVYEYARSGSLDDALFSAKSTCKALPWKDRVKVALGVAQALEYMHWICSPPIAHENIKATNILLNDGLMPHISDCGITGLKHLISKKPKPCEHFLGYTAPEQSMIGVDKTKSDIYSYGVVLLELLTGRRAFDSSRRREEQYLANWASFRLHDFLLLEEMIDPSIKGSIPSKPLSRFADIISLCLQPEPEFRSPMTEVVEKLVHLIHKMVPQTRKSSALVTDRDACDPSFKTTVASFETSPSRST